MAYYSPFAIMDLILSFFQNKAPRNIWVSCSGLELRDEVDETKVKRIGLIKKLTTYTYEFLLT